MPIGAHVPITGGIFNAPGNGRAIGADAIQVFTRNQMQWACRPLSAEECARFRAAMKETGMRAAMTHASYLVNLAGPEGDFLDRSRAAMVTEMQRCHALGIPHLVFHPGAHMGRGEKAGMAALAKSLDAILAATRGLRVTPLLEVTAGQGTSVGHRFEHLAEVLQRVKEPRRLGVCLDTCHLFAAGYDVSTAKGYEQTIEAFDRLVGLRTLQAIHLNDSRRELGSRVDRHARAGEGLIGLEMFRRVVNDPRLRDVPKVVETPGPTDAWRKEVALIRGLVGKAAIPRKRASRRRP
ncbi:MAG TPA: deoxyribonuclease IV [Vicinamibacteria bacterium]|nr:deoxyribonuclease IV [Vicinamibacteria bacterium]